MISARTKTAAALLFSLSAIVIPAARAQSEGWILGPGSRNDQNSTVVPTNCVTDTDGTVTCDTKLENPDSRPPARPYYNPFND